jgi:hypothetical protein
MDLFLEEVPMSQSSDEKALERDNRKFSVSANRGQARGRIRYVETGGAAVDLGECTFCQAVPSLDDKEGVRVDPEADRDSSRS